MNNELPRKPYVWSERAALKAAAHEWRCSGSILTGIGLAAILMACWRFGFVWLAVVCLALAWLCLLRLRIILRRLEELS